MQIHFIDHLQELLYESASSVSLRKSMNIFEEKFN